MLKKTSFATLFLLVLATLFLVQCNSNSNQVHEESGVVKSESKATEINFIGQWLNEGIREDLVRNIARSYEFQHQDIHINLKFPEEIYYKREDMYSNQKFVAGEVVKEVGFWDIIRINGEFETIAEKANDQQWAKKYLVDFSTMPEYVQHTMPTLLTDSVKKRWNGILPGPFVEGSFWAFWVNSNVAKKLGIEVKQFGMTFDDFERYIEAVYNYNKKNPNDHITAIFEAGDWPTIHAFVAQLFATVLNDDAEFFTTSRSEKKLQAWHKTLKLLERLVKYEPISRDWKQVGWAKTTQDMLDEKYLFYSNGSWMYNIWQQKDDKKVSNCYPAEYPSLNEAKTYQSAYVIMWAVPKNAPHKEEAIKFLISLNQPSFADMWVRYTKCPTGITGSLTGVNFGADKIENFSYYIQNKFGTHTFLQEDANSKFFGVANAKVQDYIHEVLLGDMTADEAMRKIRNQLH